MSRPYAEVIGDPIAHSKSPLIHNFWLKKLGIDAEYRACHVRPEELASYFAQRRADPDWRGCNVTIPYKVAVLSFVDMPGAMVEAVGAANCIYPRRERLGADNTDIYGVGDSLPTGLQRICVIGAGGAARAALAALDQAAVRDVRVIVRDCQKAHSILNADFPKLRYFAMTDAAEAIRGAEGLINASPLGMDGQPAMPANIIDAIELTENSSFVFDMVYAPLETELLLAARSEGRRSIDGLIMLISQAGYAFRMFFGVRPDREHQHDAELRALLTA